MRQLASVVLFISVLVLFACSTSSSSSPGAGDAGGGDSGGADASCDAGYKCGNPCIPGNSKGVGQFCDHITDCLDTTEAHLCATLGDSTQHFCTFVCHGSSDGGADGDANGGADAGPSNECGENASCQCQGGQCGCFPDFCK